MMGLDLIWQQCEAFERSQSEALAQAMTPEFAPKYQHARTIFFKSNRVYSSADLQLDRLATPPVEETDEENASENRNTIQPLGPMEEAMLVRKDESGRWPSGDLV
jgi:hypothetical protein